MGLLVPRLYDAFRRLQEQRESGDECPSALKVWMAYIGASCAEDSVKERTDWFWGRVAEGMERLQQHPFTDHDAVRPVISQFLYSDNES